MNKIVKFHPIPEDPGPSFEYRDGFVHILRLGLFAMTFGNEGLEVKLVRGDKVTKEGRVLKLNNEEITP